MKSRKMMKSKKSCSTQPHTCAYIPAELLTQILAILPVKTLVRFRCVCKSWRSIIDDPVFVSMHRKLNNFTSSKLVSLEGLGAGGYSGCSLTVRNANTFRKTGSIFKSSERYYLHGRCDSLLLMFHPDTYEMRLINASIRKSLLLADCPILPCFGFGPEFVFGFARLSQDYKIIAISFESIERVEPRQTRVAVYTLSDQQWAIRDNGRVNINWSTFDRICGPYYVCDGAAHWLGNEVGHGGNRRPGYLVSLDFDTEIFTFSELPHELDAKDSSRSLFLLGESLAILCVSGKNTSIWVLEKNSGKRDWTLWFSGRSSPEGLNLFYRSMQVIRRVLYYEGDGGYIVYGKQSYNIATGQVQLLGKSITRHVEFEKYSESLVLCNGYETEDMTSSPFVLNK
ncbi:F-box/kelch-repeat protein At3g06240-like [Silene latifolia]|uniref:F-box/kelch-repeat protein At3g06240-like n=1 Tax=Silene latifolia TaxID=37657 RepID=UPI003D77D2AA